MYQIDISKIFEISVIRQNFHPTKVSFIRYLPKAKCDQKLWPIAKNQSPVKNLYQFWRPKIIPLGLNPVPFVYDTLLTSSAKQQP